MGHGLTELTGWCHRLCDWASDMRAVKLPWIFPGATLIFNTGNIQCNLTALEYGFGDAYSSSGF